VRERSLVDVHRVDSFSVGLRLRRDTLGCSAKLSSPSSKLRCIPQPLKNKWRRVALHDL